MQPTPMTGTVALRPSGTGGVMTKLWRKTAWAYIYATTGRDLLPTGIDPGTLKVRSVVFHHNQPTAIHSVPRSCDPHFPSTSHPRCEEQQRPATIPTPTQHCGGCPMSCWILGPSPYMDPGLPWGGMGGEFPILYIVYPPRPQPRRPTTTTHANPRPWSRHSGGTRLVPYGWIHPHGWV